MQGLGFWLFGGIRVLTDYCLRVFGARGAQAEFAQGVFGLLREGVEAGFGGLDGLGVVRMFACG